MRWRSMGVRSLYLNIYLTVVAALLVFALLVVVLVSRHTEAENGRIELAVSDRTQALAALLENSLPPATAEAGVQREALLEWSHRLRIPLALDDMAGQRILEAGLPWVLQRGGRVDHQRPRVERLLNRRDTGVTGVTPDRRHAGRALGGGPTKLGHNVAFQLANMLREGHVPDQVVRLHMVLVDDRPLAPAGADPQVQHGAAERASPNQGCTRSFDMNARLFARRRAVRELQDAHRKDALALPFDRRCPRQDRSLDLGEVLLVEQVQRARLDAKLARIPQNQEGPARDFLHSSAGLTHQRNVHNDDHEGFSQSRRHAGISNTFRQRGDHAR